jgi:ATP-dependent RNA helicase DeaD
MLDMGFAEELDAILEATPAAARPVLFSATLPARIGGIARRHLRDPVRHPDRAGPRPPPARRRSCARAPTSVQRRHKPAALGRVLDLEAPAAAIVFCRTRNEVDQLTGTLNGRGYRAEALHGGMNQEQRDRVMARLRNGTAELLVATDVAARGLDIDHLSHVVNYDVPSAPESYVHRIGRVGRAGRQGVAITLAEPREHRLLKNIEQVTKQRITVEKVPTVADVVARRLDLTRATLRESILEDELDRYRVVVDTLTDEFDLVQVALAAVKLAHEATGVADDDDEDIPDATPRPSPERARPAAGARPRRGQDGPMTRLFVGAGRKAGIRPQDLVGAIANESRLSGRQIGAIEIADRFSLVEVPADAAEEVVAALRASTIKGKKQTVRLERDGGPSTA